MAKVSYRTNIVDENSSLLIVDFNINELVLNIDKELIERQLNEGSFIEYEYEESEREDNETMNKIFILNSFHQNHEKYVMNELLNQRLFPEDFERLLFGKPNEDVDWLIKNELFQSFEDEDFVDQTPNLNNETLSEEDITICLDEDDVNYDA